MSIFGDQYSHDRHQLHREEIRHIVSRGKTPSLTQEQELLVEKSIVKYRDEHGDGTVSMHGIHDVLVRLGEEGISKHDRHGVMRAFEEFFKEDK